ncbi:hypothetical protein Pint_33594 [Pistacia integerrima]|uniref:Uncharacterized protein n=1 Tax=Pistacia integerrima TaxID=434235 RepID=A0ACC0X6Y5_9ROSI|nr:hypothetical protein Pint_33594 [Pistacia integerrima]
MSNQRLESCILKCKSRLACSKHYISTTHAVKSDYK